MRNTNSGDYADYSDLVIAWPATEVPASEAELVRQGYAKKLKFDRRYRWRKVDLVEHFRHAGFPAATIDQFAENLGIKSVPGRNRKARAP
jgi:hypothetical protein